MHPFLTIATRAVRKAGSHIMRACERIDDIKILLKEQNDYVTEVDQACERIIIDMLAQSYPQHGFLGEESGEIKGGGEYRWIIDPLDGTTNFIHGYPHFSISLACEYQGRIEHGLIYDPVRDDLFTTSRGSGAYCNDRRIRVKATKSVSNALIALSFNKRELNSKRLQAIMQVTQQAGAMRRAGSAALDLAHVAAGRLDACIQWGMKPWDIAAGTLMMIEAGGGVVGTEGEDFLATGSFIAGHLKLLPALEALLA